MHVSEKGFYAFITECIFEIKAIPFVHKIMQYDINLRVWAKLVDMFKGLENSTLIV